VRRSITLLAAALAAVAMLAAGCGGSSSSSSSSSGSSSSSSSQKGGEAKATPDEAGVREALEVYGAAFVKGDQKGACARMTADAKKAAVKAIPKSKSCEGAHQRVFEALDPEQRQKFADAISDERLDIEFSSPTAAQLEKDGSEGTVKMSKVGGIWMIDQSLLLPRAGLTAPQGD
jgi:hypothetical protein